MRPQAFAKAAVMGYAYDRTTICGERFFQHFDRRNVEYLRIACFFTPADGVFPTYDL